MTFRLFYKLPKQGSRYIDVPDLYMGFVNTRDLDQLNEGLGKKNNRPPTQARLKTATLKLAKHRKEH